MRIATTSLPRDCLNIAGLWARRRLNSISCRSRWQSFSASEEYSASTPVSPGLGLVSTGVPCYMYSGQSAWDLYPLVSRAICTPVSPPGTCIHWCPVLYVPRSVAWDLYPLVSRAICTPVSPGLGLVSTGVPCYMYSGQSAWDLYPLVSRAICTPVSPPGTCIHWCPVLYVPRSVAWDLYPLVSRAICTPVSPPGTCIHWCPVLYVPRSVRPGLVSTGVPCYMYPGQSAWDLYPLVSRAICTPVSPPGTCIHWCPVLYVPRSVRPGLVSTGVPCYMYPGQWPGTCIHWCPVLYVPRSVRLGLVSTGVPCYMYPGQSARDLYPLVSRAICTPVSGLGLVSTGVPCYIYSGQSAWDLYPLVSRAI